ncbi:ras association domain-containing protein 2b [Alosa sapidissima]|uniref:ras association domain-containing protein 2b n=1 Tax=Alosa sapidissima TaxID=34773 RepID=UPI001C08F148|nr:ras association domain-containing protein 2b [Alosa sapidissima]
MLGRSAGCKISSQFPSNLSGIAEGEEEEVQLTEGEVTGSEDMEQVNQDHVKIGEGKYVTKKSLLSHLKTYNMYYEGQSLQLRHREEEGEGLIVEGLLNVCWGLRRPIRLQMQDDVERIRSPPSPVELPSEDKTDFTKKASLKLPAIKVTSPLDQSEGSADGYGSVTNVRVNSSMTTAQVLRVLLKKFKIENSPDEFSLFLIHTSGDHPLAVRIMEGPCEQVSKIFLMDTDQVEEVTHDVAQYIKFEMPVLQSFITKLKEEEDREVQKLKNRYQYMRCMIEKHMQTRHQTTTCV